jgi:preprotein translocase subunit YajC
MYNLNYILLFSPSGGDSNPMASLIPLLLIVVIFYFFMIRPQMKRQKEQRKFRENLKKGDKIITIGGIHGRIVEVQDTSFTIEVENGVRFRVEKSAIASSTEDQLTEKK